MDTKTLDCETIEKDDTVCVCKGTSLTILADVQKAYEERIKLVKKSGGRNKMQKELEVMRSWVRDLVDQNNLLVRTIEDMEVEITSRVMFERRKDEMESELRAEVAALRKQLARKDSDLQGLLEVLRRLREYDRRSIDDIHFYEWDCKKTICEKVNELKVLNDTLQKENAAKDREIRKLTKDVQKCEQTVLSLTNEISMCKYQMPDVPKKEVEVMTEVCCPSTECGDIMLVEECGVKELSKYQERIHQLEMNLKSSSENIRTMRKENVDLREEVRGMSHLCAALDEHRRAAALRLQFKDDIIREMRHQLGRYKAKLREATGGVPVKKADVSGDHDSNNTPISYDTVLACVRQQPRRKRRVRAEMNIMDIEWSCQSHLDGSGTETASTRAD